MHGQLRNDRLGALVDTLCTDFATSASWEEFVGSLTALHLLSPLENRIPLLHPSQTLLPCQNRLIILRLETNQSPQQSDNGGLQKLHLVLIQIAPEQHMDSFAMTGQNVSQHFVH